VRDIALDATLRAAALRQALNLSSVEAQIPAETGQAGAGPASHEVHRRAFPLVSRADLRVKVRHARTGNLILFVVDASGSMGARKRMVAVKGAVLSLLLDAYQKRDRVGLISFRGAGAQLLVPPTNSVELAERHLRRLPTGGKTPLAAGLQLADQLLTSYLQRESAFTPLLVVVTDGRANAGHPAQLSQVAATIASKQIASLILDSEQGFVRLGLAHELAARLMADYLPLDELHAESISRQVRQHLFRAD
jgi:magnesium chelatase subunit D